MPVRVDCREPRRSGQWDERDIYFANAIAIITYGWFKQFEGDLLPSELPAKFAGERTIDEHVPYQRLAYFGFGGEVFSARGLFS
jgi:hypothetical protein